MSAISVRQKDQEIEELRRELDVYKGLVADLTDKQSQFEEALDLLRARLPTDSKSQNTSDSFVTAAKLDAVTQELHNRVGTFIKTVNSNLRLDDKDGVSNLPAELDGLQGRLAGLEEDVRNVRRGREFTDERLGKVEGVCLNVLSNVFGESKADAIRYFRSTTNFPGKIDAGPVKRISTVAGPGPEAEDKSPDDSNIGIPQVEIQQAADTSLPGTSDDPSPEKPEVEKVVEGGNGKDTDEGIGHEYEPGHQPRTPDFVPSINDGPYAFTATDGSPIERASKRLP